MRLRPILLLFLSAAPAPVGAVELRFPVSYRSASTVYIAAGSADSLAVGERLSVKAKSELVGEIEILYLSEHSSSCRILRESRPIRVGDVGVITRAADHASKSAPEERVSNTVAQARPAAAPPTSTTGTPSRTAPIPWARTRGSVNLGLSRSWDRTERHYDFEERHARLDFTAWEIGGHPLQFTARARSRQDLRPQTLGFEALPRDERRDRLYEVGLRYEPRKGRAVIEAGRLGVPLLGIGYLDGAALEFRALKSLRVGGFFGKRAEIDRITGFASGNKYGAYLRLFNGGSSWPGVFDLNFFGVREFAGASVSREYVGAQSRFARKSFLFSQWTEVDLLRDWRKPADGRASQVSNLSASVTYRPKPSSSLGLSYDQRRNYRTAETRSVPEILFDTYVHQGLRANFDVARANGFGGSIFGGARMRDQQADQAYSAGAGLRHPSLTGARLSASLDGYFFTNESTSGLQGNARLGRVRPNLMTDLTFGIAAYSLKEGARRRNEWFRVSAHKTFGRALWIHAEGQYDRGDDVKGPRASFEIGYRF
jgi:hypothetical protein